MFKKHGKYVARWTRLDGGRSIKVFPTAKAARAYANRQRREVAAKKARAKTKPSRRSRQPG